MTLQNIFSDLLYSCPKFVFLQLSPLCCKYIIIIPDFQTSVSRSCVFDGELEGKSEKNSLWSSVARDEAEEWT